MREGRKKNKGEREKKSGREEMEVKGSWSRERKGGTNKGDFKVMEGREKGRRKKEVRTDREGESGRKREKIGM